MIFHLNQILSTCYFYIFTLGASTLGLNRQARSGSSSSESQGKVASSAPRTACPSSPGLGSRALKKLKQTFSSDKRKSGPQPGI